MKGQFILIFFLRVLLGAGIFWLGYLFLGVDAYELTGKIALIVLLSTIATVSAMILSYMFVAILLLMRKESVDFEDIVGQKILTDVLYEMWEIILNAGAISAGVILFLQDSSIEGWKIGEIFLNPLTVFILFYIAFKIGLRIIAYVIAHTIEGHLVMMLFTFSIFFILLTIAGVILYLNPPEFSWENMMNNLQNHLPEELV